MYVSYNEISATNILVSSTDLKSWTVLTTPSHACALTTYRSQLVLIGGTEITTKQITNKLWTSDDGMDWVPSLPPMPTARSWVSVVNTRSPECLVVAGGEKPGKSGRVSTVEVLIEEQWYTVQPLPKRCLIYDSAVHDGKVFFYAWVNHHTYQCDLNSLISSCTHPDVGKEALWSSLHPGYSMSFTKLASFGQRLIGIDRGWVRAYSPITNSWEFIGECSKHDVQCLYALPTSGDLLVFMKGFPNVKLFRVSVRGENFVAEYRRNLCVGIPLLACHL